MQAESGFIAEGVLSAQQRRMVSTLWLTYAAFYLGRLNLSPALPAIAESLQISLAQVGILGTFFFWCYALGQLVNGQIGNSVRPHRVILFGLLLIAISNIAFSLQTSLLMMTVIWGVNGFAQSTGWGPMLRILSTHLETAQRKRLSTVFSMSFQVGTALAWGVAGILMALGNWRLAFLVPGLALFVVALLWWLSGLDAAPVNRDEMHNTTESFSLAGLTQEVRRLLPMLIAAAFVGFVYISFFLWLPALIGAWDFLPAWLLQSLTALVPLIGIPGMLFAGTLLSYRDDLLQTLLILLSVLFICLLLSFLTASFAQIVFVFLAVMIAGGLAGLLLSSVPMLIAQAGRTSSAGGLMTAVWSIAGGLSGTIVGAVVEGAGWSAVFILWMGLIVVAMGALLYASRHFAAYKSPHKSKGK